MHQLACTSWRPDVCLSDMTQPLLALAPCWCLNPWMCLRAFSVCASPPDKSTAAAALPLAGPSQRQQSARQYIDIIQPPPLIISLEFDQRGPQNLLCHESGGFDAHRAVAAAPEQDGGTAHVRQQRRDVDIAQLVESEAAVRHAVAESSNIG